MSERAAIEEKEVRRKSDDCRTCSCDTMRNNQHRHPLAQKFGHVARGEE